MALFSYKAQDASNNVKRGTIEDSSRDAVATRLMKSGLRPLEIKRAVERKGKAGIGISLDRFRSEKVNRTDIDFFTKQVSLLLGAGLSLDKALRTIKQHSHKDAFGEFVGDVERKLKEGKSFSEALAEYPKDFSPMYVNIVRAGEEGGILPAMLTRIAEYQATFQELKQFVVSAAIYPAFLLCIGMIAVIILVTAILPNFEVLFEGMGKDLPMNVRVMIETSRAITDHWLISLVVLIGTPLGIYQYFRGDRGKESFDRLSIRLPILSSFIKDLETTRIFRTIEVLVNNGVHLATALRISSGVAGNREFQRLLVQATAALKEGQQVGLKLKGSGLLPDLAADLLAIGEDSGSVGQVCGQIADHYEDGLRVKTKRIIALVEPVFILIIALGAGYVVFTMLSVILNINDIGG